MKRTIILTMAVAAMLSSCKNNAETTSSIGSAEKYEGTLRSKGTVRGEGNTYSIFPSDTLVPFVDELVNDVYRGKLQAYYYVPDSPEVERTIAVKDLGKLGCLVDTIETNGKKEVIKNYFKPSDASFVSFEQKYFYDVASRKIRTEVSKVFIARDARTSDGKYVGAEPIFYIRFN